MRGAILIVGAGGFVGRHLLDSAEAAGLPAVAAGREASAAAPACDLLDPAAIERCLEAVAPAAIVNLAGAPSVAGSWERPQEAFAVNAAAVLNLLEAASRCAPEAHVLCLSSAAVYGEPGEGEMPLAETAAVAPVSPYGAAKASMESICGEYARSRGLAIAAVRAFNLLGPRQPPFHAPSGLAREVAAAERAGGGSVQLALGNPGARRDYTDVRDAAAALLAVSRRRLEGTFNLCSGRAASVAELAAGLAVATPLAVETRVDPALARPADPPLLVGDPSRLREATGFVAETPLDESLADLLEWWRGQSA